MAATPGTGAQFFEVLEIIEEINVQAERLQGALNAAKMYLTNETQRPESEQPDDSHGSG